MVRFSKLNPDGSESEVRHISQADIKKCPHVIFMPEHYRADGTCKCNDPNETVMRDWGYQWSDTTKRWEA